MALVNIKETGLMDRWGDSLGTAYFDGKIHAVGQAEVAIVESNKHYVFDLNGNVLYKITAPFEARAESICSTLNGKLYLVGGVSPTAQNVWVFDPTIAGYTAGSWSSVGSYTSAIGSHPFCFGADMGGWFYYGGGVGINTFWRTQNFTTWENLGTLPSNISELAACGSCVHNGSLYVIGGTSQTTLAGGGAAATYAGNVHGYVYKYTHGTGWELVTQDKERFGQQWLDSISDGTYIYTVKGYISPAQFATYGATSARQGNNRGLMRSTDGVTWEDMSLFDGMATLFERHRSVGVRVDNTAYFLAGWGSNDMWKIV